jgi:hypothetical protein
MGTAVAMASEPWPAGWIRAWCSGANSSAESWPAKIRLRKMPQAPWELQKHSCIVESPLNKASIGVLNFRGDHGIVVAKGMRAQSHNHNTKLIAANIYEKS